MTCIHSWAYCFTAFIIMKCIKQQQNTTTTTKIGFLVLRSLQTFLCAYIKAMMSLMMFFLKKKKQLKLCVIFKCTHKLNEKREREKKSE